MRTFLVFLCGMAAALACGAAVISEDFSADPMARGWKIFGDTSLFHWDATNQNVAVTWDSSKSNSYFYLPLDTILAKDDDFSLSFDLRLDEIIAGPNPSKPGAFEISIGFLNLVNATRTNFFRGTGVNSPNLVEFAYFPDAGFGATLWPTFVSSNGVFNYNGDQDYTLIALTTGDLFHVAMAYSAGTRRLVTTMTRNGAPFGPIHDVPLSPAFSDFRVGAFSISSFSDAGNPYDSVLAHGILDNIVITAPSPIQNVSGALTNSVWQARFSSRTNWFYTLERTVNLQAWESVSAKINGTGTSLFLMESNSIVGNGFYRIRAERP